MSMPAIAKRTMLCTPRSVYFARSFFSRSNGATSSPFTISAIASTSCTMGARLCRPMAKRYERPTTPPSVSRSISTSGATVSAPVLVASGRRIGAATARAFTVRMRSAAFISCKRLCHDWRMLRTAAFLLLAIPLAAIAQARLADDFSQLPAGASIVLMPADIELFEISAGGVVEPRADWTKVAVAHIERGLRARGALWKEFPAGNDPAIDGVLRLHRAVADAIIVHHFGSLKLPTKEGRLDWSLGPDAAPLAGRTGADY